MDNLELLKADFKYLGTIIDAAFRLHKAYKAPFEGIDRIYDTNYMSAIYYNLSNVGEFCGHAYLSYEFKSYYDEIDWLRLYRFRNIVNHNSYDNVDEDTILSFVKNFLSNDVDILLDIKADLIKRIKTIEQSM